MSRWPACYDQATPAAPAPPMIDLVELALAQLPPAAGGRPVLVGSDSDGASTRLG